MSHKAGDYLVCRLPGTKKNFLMIVARHERDTIHGHLARDFHIPNRRSVVEAVDRDVIVNLGQEPRPGKVYGVDVQRSVGHKYHESFGTIHFFYKPGKELGRQIMDSFAKVERILAKNQLDFILGDGIWEVHPAMGTYAGKYMRSRKPEVSPHRFHVAPERVQPAQIPYVLIHELAHHLHAEFLPTQELPGVNAAWVKLFNTSIKPTSVSKDKSLELLSALKSHDGPPSSLGSTLSEDDTRAYRQVLRAISAQRAVTVKELDLLYESANLEAIEELWPRRAIPLKELAPVVSEYATKSYRELFAESIAFHLTGMKLPKEVSRLVEKSLSLARKTSKG